MSTKKAPARRKKAARKAKPTPLVLDVTVHFSAYLEQHVAIDAAREKPLAEWTFNDVLDAAKQVAHLLPVSNREAVMVGSLMWSKYDLATEAPSGVLHVQIHSADTHDPRHLTLTIRDFPRAAAIRCVAPSAELMSAARVDEPIVGRGAGPADRGCLSVVPGTVRNPYEIRPTLTGNFDKEDRLRRLAKVAAIQAARRAAKLPKLASSEGAR